MVLGVWLWVCEGDALAVDDHEAVPAWEAVSDSEADMLCDRLAVADCDLDARCVPLKL